MEPSSLTCCVIGAIDSLLHIATGFLEHLAHLTCHVAGVLLFVLFENRGEFVQKLGTFRSGRPAPFSGGLLRGGNGLVHIRRIRFGELSDHVARIGRIDIQEPLLG